MEHEMDREERDSQRVLAMDRTIRRYNTMYLALGIVCVTFGAFYFGLPNILSFGKASGEIKGNVALAVGFLALARVVVDSRIRDIEADKNIIRARSRVQEQLPTTAEKPKPGDKDSLSTEDTYFDNLVKINVENLAAYYELVKTQTDKSFRASLTVAYFGAFLIMIGLALGFYRTDAADKVTYIATGAGVLTEFISGVFFWLYSRTVNQLRGYHDSLVSVQNILLSFKLVSDTRDPKEKAQMVSKMCSYLLAGLPNRLVNDKPEKDKAEGSVADGNAT
jgi:hypothetical protein